MPSPVSNPELICNHGRKLHSPQRSRQINRIEGQFDCSPNFTNRPSRLPSNLILPIFICILQSIFCPIINANSAIPIKADG